MQGINTQDYSQTNDLAVQLTAEIRAFLKSPANSLHMHDPKEPVWETPLIGFAQGDDPIFEEFQRHIGVFYWTPREAFAFGYPDTRAAAKELTVVSWVLPHTSLTKNDNRRQSALPSERWNKAKLHGEHINQELRRYLVSHLAEWGIEAVAPLLLPECQTETSEHYGLSSTWSERHTAHAAGLGTFGLCDGLITPVGKAMRCGSLIVHAIIPPTPRPYTDHHAYCLHFRGIACKACIKRCPAGAITEAGHDKQACKAYLDSIKESRLESVPDLSPEERSYPIDSCGLCQTRVPCESGIPVQLISQARTKTS